MNKGQNTRGYERYMALDIHREYLLVGAQNEEQDWVLTPRRGEVSDREAFLRLAGIGAQTRHHWGQSVEQSDPQDQEPGRTGIPHGS